MRNGIRPDGADDSANYSRQPGSASMPEYDAGTNFIRIAGRNRMKRLLILAAGALLGAPALAQSAADYCARARDPARCEARQAAVKSCGEKRGVEKRACLEASIPPLDCGKTQDPKACEAAQNAREICRGTTGKQLKQCLREEQEPKKRKKHRSGAGNVARNY